MREDYSKQAAAEAAHMRRLQLAASATNALTASGFLPDVAVEVHHKLLDHVWHAIPQPALRAQRRREEACPDFGNLLQSLIKLRKASTCGGPPKLINASFSVSKWPNSIHGAPVINCQATPIAKLCTTISTSHRAARLGNRRKRLCGSSRHPGNCLRAWKPVISERLRVWRLLALLFAYFPSLGHPVVLIRAYILHPSLPDRVERARQGE